MMTQLGDWLPTDAADIYIIGTQVSSAIDDEILCSLKDLVFVVLFADLLVVFVVFVVFVLCILFCLGSEI